MRPTKEGKRFLLSTFLIAVAALNTGNNLMYLILSMMLAVLAVSFVILGINLRGLVLEASVEQPVFAGRKARMEISITNSKGWFASYSLRIRLPEGLEGEGYIAHVARSSEAVGRTEVLFRRRGVYGLGDFTIESSFPFIFFTRKRMLPAGRMVTVYPAIKEMELPPVFTGHGGDFHSFRPGRGEELLMIREFRYGDDIKRVHWKASAKAEKLMVKDFSEEEPKMVTIILDDTGYSDPDAFERGVSFAASAAWKLVGEGFFLRLATCSKLLPFGGGAEHLYKLLDILAEARERETWECPIGEDEIQGGSLLILKSEGSALKALAPACDIVVYASGL